MDDKKRVAPEVSVQEQPREKVEYVEKREIKQKIIHLFAMKNLTIGQCKEILTEISFDFENCIPWKQQN